jgi:hypothetical protein
MTATFDRIEEVARVMAGFLRPWFVSGGWAIDLFVGRVTREHEDLEVGILRPDQGALRAYLTGWELCRVRFEREPAEWVPWPEGERMELPEFQVRAQRGDGEPREFELFLNDVAGETWICRRNPAITRPVAEICRRGGGGIPILAPEIQLLYKAKRHRPRDEHDFQIARELLEAPVRTWLREALEIIHPGDPWIRELS